MKINMTESGYSRNLGALLSLSPVRAARGGALGWLSEALREQTPFLADRIETAAASLIRVLGVETVLEHLTSQSDLMLEILRHIERLEHGRPAGGAS